MRCRLLALAIGWVFSFLSSIYAPPAHAHGRTIRVVAYNTWGLPQPFLSDPSRFEDIAHFAPGIGADVIGFEETFTKYSRVLADLRDYPYHAYGPEKDGPFWETSSGLLLVSRWPIIETNLHEYSACRGTDCWANKGILHARVRFPEIGDIDFFVTHMNAGRSSKAESVREIQLAELMDFANQVSLDRPMVVMGDMNFDPTTRNYKSIQKTLGVFDTHQEYVDDNPWISPVEKDGYTYDPVRNTNAHGKTPMRIDYIFSRGTREQKVETTFSHTVFDQVVFGRSLSDHFGLLADLRVEN